LRTATAAYAEARERLNGGLPLVDKDTLADGSDNEEDATGPPRRVDGVQVDVARLLKLNLLDCLIIAGRNRGNGVKVKDYQVRVAARVAH